MQLFGCGLDEGEFSGEAIAAQERGTALLEQGQHAFLDLLQTDFLIGRALLALGENPGDKSQRLEKPLLVRLGEKAAA